MPKARPDHVDRRQFLKQVGAAAGAVAAGPRGDAAAEGESGRTVQQGRGLALVIDPSDALASSGPVQAAAARLRQACQARGLAARLCANIEEVRTEELCLLAAGRETKQALRILATSGVAALGVRESLALVPGGSEARPLVLATAPDALGLAYALGELADRIESSGDAREAFRGAKQTVERPTCPIRSIMRIFASDVEDRGWFHDRSFWPPYLDALVAQRFNRFNLAFGIGYDFARQLRDTYFYFPYPFLLAVPGHDVRAVGLSDGERDRNLETLRFVGDEVTKRGLHFQLGLWTHAFEWTDSPNVNYRISGLTRESQAGYCRDAVRALLAACPSIAGLTIRTHGESGVPEGDEGRYEFWQTLFSGVTGAGRPLELDLHAKGVDQRIIDLALATGLTVRVSPKFWAEHMGLPYLQSSIRALELPTEQPTADRLMSLSTGTRNHMRYSYGDLLMQGRRYGILHRVWPGTQRLLLWGDPAYAAQMGRTFAAFGADGVEFMEPLSFKGRKGSGLAGGRDAYHDTSLRAPGGDWAKYAYTYRLWGRLAYDPDANPEVWRRALRREFGPAAEAVESGLAKASRILPLITTAHCPSAANNNYWPELYSNMSLLDGVNRGSYSDTPTPRVFGRVSSLDPQLFMSVDEMAESLLGAERAARITPIEVARQLDEWAESSATDMSKASSLVADDKAPGFRRVALDCAIAAGIGRFFARKLRAGVLFGLFDRTGDARAREESLGQYRAARRVWADFASGPAASAYVRDITFGFDPHLRGHWQDRLSAIDRDIAAVEAWSPAGTLKNAARDTVAAAIAAVLSPKPRPIAVLEHKPAPSFRPGQALAIAVGAPAEATGILLQYRHLNQAETYRAIELKREGAVWRASVPAEYTRSPYPLQYYFEVRSAKGVALWPGFSKRLPRTALLRVAPGLSSPQTDSISLRVAPGSWAIFRKAASPSARGKVSVQGLRSKGRDDRRRTEASKSRGV